MFRTTAFGPSSKVMPRLRRFENEVVCDKLFLLQRSDAFGGRVTLCQHIRRVESGNTLTCAQIWYDTWGDSKSIPPSLKRRIRFRKRKREQEESE
ncbi:hypothetical protein PHPALM_30920 [Phytophthora palmivora]|uniref:Uncharacterized protein n=1 Tax=Phytophthora palmivora TaxID=4796 RepID=A0A2P4X3X8_9STRA|nr:hypothetical protein PHPALM_30920 [Phytophthora palmivora]